MSGTDSCCFQLRPTVDKGDRSLPHLPAEMDAELANNNTQFQLDVGHTTFPKKARIDLSFDDVRFTVKQWSLKNPIPVKKDILKGVSGIFPAGQLTGIMGPSGAGKSTLLNVLAGFTVSGASGRVMLNRKDRDLAKFSKLCCYIQQDDYLRKQLTVSEAMSYACDLKLGSTVSRSKKNETIKEILDMLGLSYCVNTPTGGLSGGQRKRLSIAVELISNPPVIFLDEPTTGLDSSSCTLCVSLLKFLADQGRTVVCTIHQPSSLVFEKFDNIYTLAAGKCIYSGSPKQVVPYLSGFGLHCPQYHNPADFLLDISIGDYGADAEKLSQAAEIAVTQAMADAKIEELKKAKESENNNQEVIEYEPAAKPATFLEQTSILTSRKLRMIYRSPYNMLIRAFAHFMISILFGYLYLGVGANANTVLANTVYVYGSNLFLVYTGKMSATLLFPLELLIVIREHFNRWYSLGPYYLSLMLIEIPFQVLCGLLYLPLSYYLTGQPLEWDKLCIFCASIILLSLVSQCMGFMIGILTPRKIAVFLGPIIACVLSIFGFCLRYSDTPFAFKWLYHVSYFRSVFHIAVTTVYGMGRGKLFCPQEHIYCIFQDPRVILKEFDAQNIDIRTNFAYTGMCFVVCQIATVVVVWWRLNRK